MMKVRLTADVAGLILAMSREIHPKEMIATLHGDHAKDEIVVRSVSMAPQSVYGEGFASFNPYQMPIDHSFLGVVHSHPSGVGRPSVEDMNQMRGRLMVIVTAPYRDGRDIHVFDGKGSKLDFIIEKHQQP